MYLFSVSWCIAYLMCGKSIIQVIMGFIRLVEEERNRVCVCVCVVVSYTGVIEKQSEMIKASKLVLF